jgi:hypothetical protein
MTNKYAEMLMRQQQAEKAMKVEPKTGTREVRDTNTSTMKTERTMPSKTSMQEAADAAMRAKEAMAPTTKTEMGKKKGGCVKMAKGGSVGSASKRADGCAVRGKTRGKMV